MSVELGFMDGFYGDVRDILFEGKFYPLVLVVLVSLVAGAPKEAEGELSEIAPRCEFRIRKI
jgi:hypothetical protein